MMKRGFIDWDKREISEEDFQKRKEKVTARMIEDGLAYLLIYGDVWQCDDIQYLSNFNTYTRDCLLVLNREGKLSLVSSMTPRDREWIAGFTPVPPQDISFDASLVKGADIMKKGGFSSGKVGLVGEFFPKILFDHLVAEFPGSDLADLSEWYRALRRAKDAAEMKLVKRAALLAENAAKVLTDPGIFKKKVRKVSAQAEWVAKSRGAEDYCLLCSTQKMGALDFPDDRNIQGHFSFSLLSQYKGCWAIMARTLVSPATEKRRKEDVRAYSTLVSSIQGAERLEDLEKGIKAAKARGWEVEMKSPIGLDFRTSILPNLREIPKEKNVVFGLTFQKMMNKDLFTYGETLCVGDEGYEVLTL